MRRVAARWRTYLAHVVLHKAGHASGSVGTMWHFTATRVSPAGQVGRVVELVVITPDGSALISVSARCSALAKFSSSALPRTKYVAAARAMLRGGRETDVQRCAQGSGGRKEGRKEGFMNTKQRADGATVYGHTTPKRPTPSYLRDDHNDNIQTQ